jgi:hypothetical protein
MPQSVALPNSPRISHATFSRTIDGWFVRLLFRLRSYGGLSPARETTIAAQKLRQKAAAAERRKTLASLRAELTAALAKLLLIEWQFWLVLAVATAVMVLMQYNVPFWYGGSDHSDYYWYGRYLLGDGFRGYPIPANWRTPGMGIFHILSGTVLFDTWKGFIALFAAFSVAIPVLFYLIVRPHSRNFALIAGLAVIASMSPYVYANQPLSDQVYFLLHALLFLLCVRYFQRRIHKSPALLLSIVGVAAFASLVRPVGSIIFSIFIVLALILRPGDWRRLLAVSGIYVALMAGWVLWDRAYGTNGGASPAIDYPLANELATSAERRFAEAYFSPQGLVHAESDAAAAGYPNSQALRTVLQNFLLERPGEWQRNSLFVPHSLFASYAGDPNGVEKLLQAMFLDRNTLYFGFIVRVAKDSLGADAGLSLIYRVANEHGTTGLYGIIRNFALHPTQLLFGVTPNLGARNIFMMFFRAKYREQVLHIYSIENIPQPLLTPELGPASTLILTTLRRFIDDYPQFCPQPILALCHNEPDTAYRLMAGGDTSFVSQGLEPEGFIYQVVNWYLGPALAGRAYAGADLEILHRYPKMAMLMYENLINLTVARRLGDVTVPLDRKSLDEMSAKAETYYDARVQVTDDLPRGLVKELVPVMYTNEFWKNACALHMIFYLIAPAFVFLLIAALPFLRGPTMMGACLFLIVDYTSEVSSIAVFSAWNAMRYEANFYVMPLIIACIIFGQATSDLWRKRAVSRDVSDQPSASRMPA